MQCVDKSKLTKKLRPKDTKKERIYNNIRGLCLNLHNWMESPVQG